MNDEHRRLTWKYFWKRKRQEVWDWCKNYWRVFLGFQMLSFFFLGGMLSLPISAPAAQAINAPVGRVVLIIFFIELLIVLLSLILYFIIKWIQSNWELATQDATQELNKRKRKKWK